ncbi:4351_t:CDS:2, partial [Gigaspora margarita]
MPYEQTSIDEILPTFDLQVFSIYSNEQSLQFILSDEILPTFDLQVLSVCSNRQNSQSILNDEILPTFDSQVLSICSNEQSSQLMLSDKILPVFGSQVPSICSILRSDILNTNDIENKFVNYNISDRNEHQNVEFKDQEKLEIVFVNASCPKKTGKIKINSCYLEHCNYEIYPDTINFASYYWQFSDELAEFLTAPVLSLQRAEIAEALWYSTKLVSKESITISLLQEQSEIDFYENLDDFLATNVNEIISSLPTLSIQEIWETTRYRASHKNYLLISQPLITYKDGSATSNFISDLTLIYLSSGISFNISKTLNNCCAYGVMNGFCKKAIVVRLDAGSAAIETLNKFLEKFIQQYSVDSNDNQENVTPFDVFTIQDPAVKKRQEAPRVK